MDVCVHIFGTNTDICYDVAKMGFFAKSRKTSERYRAIDIECYGAMITGEGVYLIKDENKAASVYEISARDYRYAYIENYNSAKDRDKKIISQLMEEMEV